MERFSGQKNKVGLCSSLFLFQDINAAKYSVAAYLQRYMQRTGDTNQPKFM